MCLHYLKSLLNYDTCLFYTRYFTSTYAFTIIKEYNIVPIIVDNPFKIHEKRFNQNFSFKNIILACSNVLFKTAHLSIVFS
jgi:hypothetical protein